MIEFKQGNIYQIIKTTTLSNNMIDLGKKLGIDFKFHLIDNKYWMFRLPIEKIYKGIRSTFSNLIKEYIPECNCYFLDMNEGDYRTISQAEIRALNILTPTKATEDMILLSPEGLIKLLARSTNNNMKIILIWLTRKLKEYRLFDFKNFQMNLFKCMTPSERTFYAYVYDFFPTMKAQYNISRMHVDFSLGNVCFEIDGGYHLTKEQWLKDSGRDYILSKEGYITKHIPNDIVMNHVDWVRNIIIKFLKLVNSRGLLIE